MTTHTKTATTPATTTATERATPVDGVAEAMKLLDQVIAFLALSPLQNLTAKQRRAATRSRKGMEKVVPTLAALSAEHGVSVPKRATSEMTSKMAKAAELDSVSQKLVGLATLVTNNSDSARSGAWTTASILYGMMQPVAKRDAQLEAQLAPVKEFFGYRTRAAKKAHPKSKSKKAALAAATSSTASAGSEAATTAESSGAATGVQAAAGASGTEGVTKGG